MNATEPAERHVPHGSASAEQSVLLMWAERSGRERYLAAIYLLQDRGRLSFKEARAWLLPSQFIRRLAAEWGCSEENIHNLRRRGSDKIRMTENDNGESVLSEIPAYLYHIF